MTSEARIERLRPVVRHPAPQYRLPGPAQILGNGRHAHLSGGREDRPPAAQRGLPDAAKWQVPRVRLARAALRRRLEQLPADEGCQYGARRSCAALRKQYRLGGGGWRCRYLRQEI